MKFLFVIMYLNVCVHINSIEILLLLFWLKIQATLGFYIQRGLMM